MEKTKVAALICTTERPKSFAKHAQLYNLPRGLKLKAGAYRNYYQMAGKFSGIFREEKSRSEARRNDVA